MKRFFKLIVPNVIVMVVFAVIMCTISSCDPPITTKPQPLNITMFLDLSDRLVRDNQIPNQMTIDTEIVSHICEYFHKQTNGKQILSSKNKIKVMFYPAPVDPDIANVAKKLNVDMATIQGVEKRKTLESLSATFKTTLENIYKKTVDAQAWVGCDIWGFFVDKKVDDLCVCKGARNIIVILTDGYLYHVDNKINEGEAYSYILPQTLSNSKSSLLVPDSRKSTPLDNLEVLMLEINPYTPAQGTQMKPILENWFKEMGVKKFKLVETDSNVTNTETIIDNFLNE